jgi:hypothetical protein
MAKMTPDDWMVEIENGLEYRRIFGYEDSWDKLEQNFYNSPTGDASVGANLIFSMGDSLLSGLIVPEPEFTITAETPSSVDKVPMLEAVDNWLTRKTKLKEAVEDAELHNYLKGKAIIKLGYDSEWGWDPDYDTGQVVGNRSGSTFTQFDKKGNRIEYNNYDPGMPWARAVNPKDFVVPWGCKTLDDAQWVAHRLIRLNSDLKKDPKYSNTTKLEPQISMDAYINADRRVQRPPARRTDHIRRTSHTQNTFVLYNEIWEIRDRKTGEIIVITADYDKFLRKDVDALQLYGIPYVATGFIPSTRSFWTTPQAYYLGQNQAEENDIAIQATKTRRINVMRYMVDESIITRDEAEKWISSDVGGIGFYKGGKNGRDVITTVTNTNSYNYIVDSNANRTAAREAIGFSQNQIGEFDSKRTTAREVSHVAAGSDKRDRRRIDGVRKLYGDVIKGYNNFIFTFWNQPRGIMSEGKPFTFTGAELKGDYSYSTMLNTKRIIGKSERKVEAMLVLQQFAGFLPPDKMGVMFDYLVDASGDPAFEKLLSSMNRVSGQPAQAQPQQAQLPQG